MSIEKEFVFYEEALKLKELGFDEPCFGYWNIDPQLKNPYFNMVKPFEHEWCLSAPTFSQCFRWFREKYEIYYTIEGSKKFGFQHFIYDEKGSYEIESEEIFKNYEEAEIACLKKLIKIVKKKCNMDNKKQTAIDWLHYQLSLKGSASTVAHCELFEQARQIEKEQMSDFANDYADQVMAGMMKRAEQYYNDYFAKPQTKEPHPLFMWNIVTPEKAQQIFTSGQTELFILHNDGSESLIETQADLDNAIKKQKILGIEIHLIN